LQQLKQQLAIVSVDEGMQIDSIDAQYPKAHSPRVEIVEPYSNATFERLLQELTQ
jgi:hypothetical protein